LQVKEADIELNAKMLYGPSAKLAPDDLRLIVLHEVGHLLGLKDTCATNHSGTGVDWSACPEPERDSVMFAPGRRQELTQKDIDRVCELYPKTSGGTLASTETKPSSNKPVGSCHCQLGITHDIDALPLVAAAVLAVLRKNARAVRLPGAAKHSW
jgi:hypothetical protein